MSCAGTLEDLAQQHVELREGLLVILYADDLDEQGQLDELLADGIVSFSEAEHAWVASIDWKASRHASDDRSSSGNALGRSSSASAESG